MTITTMNRSEVSIIIRKSYSCLLMAHFTFMQYLTKSGRKAYAIEMDGNCFFRALSYELFGTQDQHLMIRTILYRTINLNQEVFDGLMMNGLSIDQHLKHLNSLNTWATQVEVAAAASVFHIPVYYCIEEYKWNIVKPLTDRKQQSIKCPILPELGDDFTLLRPNSFESLIGRREWLRFQQVIDL